MGVVSLQRSAKPHKRRIYPSVLILSHMTIALYTYYLGWLNGSSGCSPCASSCDQPQHSVPQTPPLVTTTSPCASSTPFAFEGLSSSIVSASRTKRDEFFRHVHLGVPEDSPEPGADYVLLLHSEGATPTQPSEQSATNAVENCDTLKVVHLNPYERRHCLAVWANFESYHVDKYMRLPEDVPRFGFKHGQSGINASLPLRYVSRTQVASGKAYHTPMNDHTMTYWNDLVAYLTKLPSLLERLGPVAAEAAGDGRDIIVMIVNFGQSSLLFNLVCSARARKIDLSHALLFATDDQAAKLGRSLGLHVFEVGEDFGKIESKDAQKFRDNDFKAMMFGKLYCVHLINQLGYNLLFSDVDMVFYRNPLDYFAARHDFDVYFQDDGSRSYRYAPYSPNSGFYYIRHNDRTTFFLNTFVRMGDLIAYTGSHQSPMHAVLVEHASWRGLRVKTFGRDSDEGHLFPGGFHYQERREYMVELLKGQHHPYIFHMSWAADRKNKRPFFEQMGEWYVHEQCLDTTVEELEAGQENVNIMEQCCSSRAITICHFDDRPCKSNV